ncbi:hypothetical protein BT96DRAFT_974660 [Gymnopus androsaceus JB14]|uniref:Fungal-type protein kinase domain-containing protein n=1 Tax=Gymnopus androsaceus JB14 TaxID=1447944 RepID=A0A6A4HV47_9AGAR|nr:hypothetical protein BT96DRAFT_974660 [Gymnopus androsaceus JB14]
MPGEKHKISRPSSIEMIQALNVLKRLRSSLVAGEEHTGDQIEDSDLSQDKLEDMIVQSKMSGTRTLNFSSASEETLTKLNIVQRCCLKLKSDSEERIKRSKSIGKDEFWSSAQMYLHLALLERLVPRENETTSRPWIDTFFYRASAMVASGKRMVINMEHVMPTSSMNTGFTYYTAVIAENSAAAAYHGNPGIASARMLKTGFFVTEAQKGPLFEHIPHAVCQLYASSKQIRKDTVRGALTNGHEWMFIIFSLNKDGNGASYKLSTLIQYTVINDSLDGYGDLKPVQPWPDIIAGILLDWTQKSFDDLDNDDWFEVVA